MDITKGIKAMAENECRLVDLSTSGVLTPEDGRKALLAFVAEHGDEVYECEVTDCNHWNGQVRPEWSFKGERQPLYRWACLAVNEEIIQAGDDRVARHACDNERCFNPEHLVWGTRSDNNKDRKWRL